MDEFKFFHFRPLQLESFKKLNLFPELAPPQVWDAFHHWGRQHLFDSTEFYDQQLHAHTKLCIREFNKLQGFALDADPEGYEDCYDEYLEFSANFGLDEHHEEHSETRDYYRSWRSDHRIMPLDWEDELASDWLESTGKKKEYKKAIDAVWFEKVTFFANVRDDEERKARVAYLRDLPYGEYLKTRHWRRARAAMILANRGACQKCPRDPRAYDFWGLHVHHLNYKNRGHEKFVDLELLCETCHKKEHGK
jgi:hypothetical protein